jgi:glycosyltransferase involved in cell wall biosynthesis
MNKTENSTKKKCLLVVPRNIFPIVSGYSKHRKYTIEILNKYYQLSIIIISDKKISQDENAFYMKNSSYFKVIMIPKWMYLFNAIISVFSSLPIQVGYYYFSKAQYAINMLLPYQDIVIGSLIRSMKYFEKVHDNCRIIFDMVDSIGLNYQNSFQKVSSFLLKIIYRIESVRLLKYEEYWIKRSHITMLFNKRECDYWSSYGKICLLPYGVDNKLLGYNKKDISYSSFVSFIGKMNYQPNIDAVIWYINNIHDKIGNEIQFIIVGAYPTHSICNIAKKNKNVSVTGFVDDPFLIINSSRLVVAPMQTGAGIQTKVLESMALGKINILTQKAADPIIGAVDGKHFLIAETPDEFCNKIIDIFQYPDKYNKVGQEARNFIIDNYTWEKYENKYIQAIESKIN